MLLHRLISARKHRQHAVHLDGVSKKLAEVSIDVGKLKHMMEALLSEQQKMGRAIKRYVLSLIDYLPSYAS